MHAHTYTHITNTYVFIIYYYYYYSRFMALLDFVQDYPGKPVP